MLSGGFAAGKFTSFVRKTLSNGWSSSKQGELAVALIDREKIKTVLTFGRTRHRAGAAGVEEMQQTCLIKSL